MKKVLAFGISLVLLLSCLFIPVSAQVILSDGTVSGSWDGTSTVLSSGRALRAKLLTDGTVAAVYYKSGDGVYFAKSYDGGISFPQAVRVVANATTELNGRMEAQNPNFIELEDGTLMVTYRYNTFTSQPDIKPWEQYYTSIRYQLSTDGGSTWGEPQVAVEWTNTDPDQKHDDGADFGFWEPDPVYINGTLMLYYADTVTPADLRYQNIACCVWNGTAFGEPVVIHNGTQHNSRDGMSVVTRLSDGTYAMVMESTQTGDTKVTFVIKMSLSTDGISWSEPVIIAKPDVAVDVPTTIYPTITEYAVCANPYIITLPDGRVAVSYQTTDRYTGVVPDRVSYRIGTQVMISNDVITADSAVSTESFTKIAEGPGELNENAFSKSASLLYANGYLMVYYQNGVNEESAKHTLGSLDVSYMKITEPVLDGTELTHYKTYNSGSKQVTAADGVFTMPSGCTNLIYGEMGEVSDTVHTPATGLYAADSYTTAGQTNYSFTTDEEAQRIVFGAGKQAKAILTDTAKMTDFTASATVQGGSTGQIWAGVTFHTQTDDFATGTFRSSGYAVYVVRQTSDLTKATIYTVYMTAGSQKKLITTPCTNFFSSDPTEQAIIHVRADSEKFYVQIENAVSGLKSDLLTYSLDATADYSGTAYYPSGCFGFLSNGSSSFTDVSLTYDQKIVESEFVAEQAQNLKASADITVPADGLIQAGLSLRVQQAENASPGLTGYVLKLVRTSSYADNKIVLQLTRYGTSSAGAPNVNLGSLYTESITSLVEEDGQLAGQTLRLEIETDNELLHAVLTNTADESKTVSYDFDLSLASSASDVTYTDYYTGGGFGLFNNAYAVQFSNISYEILPRRIGGMELNNYTVYTPVGSLGIEQQGRELVSLDGSTKKIILNDVYTSDFDADATFKIGSDGNLKAGVIFRADDLGNEADQMTGYSCVLYKTPNTTKNYSRIVLLVYKWARRADGTLAYFGTVGSKADLTTLSSVYPAAESSLLASAGAMLTLHVKVSGTTVTASWDVLDDDHLTAASSGVSTFDLTKTPTGISNAEAFNDDAYNTVYNAGAVGLSLSTKGSVLDFSLKDYETGVELWDYDKAVAYSSNTNTVVWNEDDSFTSKTAGYKQVVLTGINRDNFLSEFDFKSFSSGDSLNMGFDFCINENTHSGGAYNTNHATLGYEGYRLALVRNSNSNANPAGTVLYLFRFTKTDAGYVRTTLKTVSNADFFADYTAYGNIEVAMSVRLADGVLTAGATVKEHPERVLELTYDGIEGSGAAGYFITNGGSVLHPSVKYDISESLITAADCENGFVYAAVNSGAAGIGDTVKIVPVPAAGYQTARVYYTVGGERVEVEASDGGYLFEKVYGATAISAEFSRKGDLNGDNAADAADLTLMRQALLGIETADPAVYDLTGDGQVTIQDLVRLKKYAAGITG